MVKAVEKEKVPETLVRSKRPIVCDMNIKGPVTNEQLDIFLTEAAKLAGTHPPTYHNLSATLRCVSFEGSDAQRQSLAEAMQGLESTLLPNGTRRIEKGESLPEGGVAIRYNTIKV